MTTKDASKPILVTLVTPPGFVVGEANALPPYDGAPLELRHPCMMSLMAVRGGLGFIAIGFGTDRTIAPAGSYWHARPATPDETKTHNQFRMSQAGLTGVDVRPS